MRIHWLSHIARRTPIWVIGGAAMISWLLVGSATASANPGHICDSDRPLPSSESDATAVSTADDETSRTADTDDAPCEFSESDSPSYNICFAANPRPSSTMPKWLTRYQGEETANVIIDHINIDGSSHTGYDAHRSLSWADDVIVEMQRHRAPNHSGPTCFDGSYDEECHNLPSGAVMVTAGSVPPAAKTEEQLEAPFELDFDAALSQRPLVDLRVGPSTGHTSPPDRPPPTLIAG